MVWKNNYDQTTRTFRLNKGHVCLFCDGSGKAEKNFSLEIPEKNKNCPVCRGKGYLGMKDSYNVLVYQI